MKTLRILCVSPGASWSIADVEAGLLYGLQHYGVEVIRYRLDTRLGGSRRSLNAEWRKARKGNPGIARPTDADVVYRASVPLLEKALRYQPDIVLAVSGMFLHPDVLVLLRRAGIPTAVLLTESPYDHAAEMNFARFADLIWTNERSVVDEFKRVNPRSSYLPHGWHPDRHKTMGPPDNEMPEHDVVFVGTPFHERVSWFNAVDWSGIDLGLYGTWTGVGLKKSLRDSVRGGYTDNRITAALYRRAKIGLNLYRTSMGWGKLAPAIGHAESLSPRAYELAACGVFHVSEARAEVGEVFGDLVPTFISPAEATTVIRRWLADPIGRAQKAAQLPACVAESSWVHRAAHVIGDVQSLLQQQETCNVTAQAV